MKKKVYEGVESESLYDKLMPKIDLIKLMRSGSDCIDGYSISTLMDGEIISVCVGDSKTGHVAEINAYGKGIKAFEYVIIAALEKFDELYPVNESWKDKVLAGMIGASAIGLVPATMNVTDGDYQTYKAPSLRDDSIAHAIEDRHKGLYHAVKDNDFADLPDTVGGYVYWKEPTYDRSRVLLGVAVMPEGEHRPAYEYTKWVTVDQETADSYRIGDRLYFKDLDIEE